MAGRLAVESLEEQRLVNYELSRRIDLLEAALVTFRAKAAAYSVTAGYTADRAFNPETPPTDLEDARVLGTLIDDLKLV